MVEMESDAKTIRLSNGLSCLVDADTYADLARHKWAFNGNYAYRKAQDRVTNIYLHRLVVQAQPGTIVDHINQNKLDNRRENLRIVSKQENTWNTGNRASRKNRTSQYKGVRKSKSKKNPWTASIYVSGKSVHLGSYPTELEASNAYESAVTKYRGVEYSNG